MLVYGIVATSLCAGVIAALIVTSLRTRQTDRLEQLRDREQVSDCLANAERVIDLTDRAMRLPADDPPGRQPSIRS